MTKKPNKSKSPTRSAPGKKIAIKDLKTRDASSIKGGIKSLLRDDKHKDEIDVLQ